MDDLDYWNFLLPTLDENSNELWDAQETISKLNNKTADLSSELSDLKEEVDKIDEEIANETAMEEEAAAGADFNNEYAGKEGDYQDKKRKLEAAERMFNSLKEMIDNETD